MGTMNLDRIDRTRPRKSRRHGKVRAQRGSAALVAALGMGAVSLAAAFAPIVHALSGSLGAIAGH